VLAKLDYLARYGVRKGDRGDWEHQRRRYNAVRARVLPLLEAEEAARTERYAVMAQAAGIPLKEYRKRVEHDLLEFMQAREDLDRARGAGRITEQDWERAGEALAARYATAEAANQGLSPRAYEKTRRRSTRARKRLYGDEDPDRFSDWLGRAIIVAGGGCLAAVAVTVLAVSLLVARCSG
jgi:hypothetical protein